MVLLLESLLGNMGNDISLALEGLIEDSIFIQIFSSNYSNIPNFKSQ